MFARPLSRGPSPIPPSNAPPRSPDPYYRAYSKPPTNTEFEIERITSPSRPHVPLPAPGYEDTPDFLGYASRLLALTRTPFSISGRIDLNAAPLTLFFRSGNGVTYSLDFPVDVEYSLPASLEALLGTCTPHQPSIKFPTAYPVERPSLIYPVDLPYTFSLDLASHPILDAVRNTLFPNLPPGNYLSTMRDKLEIVDCGSCLSRQAQSQGKDGRAATIIITLPSRFEGGALVIHSPDNQEERYLGRGTKVDEIEWTAFLPGCDYSIEPVQRGTRISITYGVYLRSFGPSSEVPLLRPSDEFLDRLAPILNLSRGRKIAFHLEFDYPANPAEVLAESVVPLLRGGDSLLYHAFKLFKLTPELHWTAGGYVWPTDRSLDKLHVAPESVIGVPPVHGPFNQNPLGGSLDKMTIRARVEDSGALLFADAGITVVSQVLDASTQVVGKERVYFVSNGELEKLVVNISLVVFVPSCDTICLTTAADGAGNAADNQDAKISSLVARLTSVLSDVQLYKQLVRCQRSDAQMLLDSFQRLLDMPGLELDFRKSLIVAMQRISTNSGLYPTRYQLKGVVQDGEYPISRGGFADIFKGHLQGQAVCMKVIRVYQNTMNDILKQISKEALLWGQLSHSNILTIYGVYRFQNQICIVSPWMENGDITKYLKLNPDAPRLRLAADVALGLTYLHENDIVHGDIKGVRKSFYRWVSWLPHADTIFIFRQM
ncbi:hypothetical protein H0H92_005558 [Tricholoma furcatifolium]|nr:hypothetical protein H0H92_005558 [Tricholoma furcatifolium]